MLYYSCISGHAHYNYKGLHLVKKTVMSMTNTIEVIYEKLRTIEVITEWGEDSLMQFFVTQNEWTRCCGAEADAVA